jgi:hypothetical protein
MNISTISIAGDGRYSELLILEYGKNSHNNIV